MSEGNKIFVPATTGPEFAKVVEWHGDIAVTEDLNGQGYCVTHAATGCKFPYLFESPLDASEVAKKSNDIADWGGFIKMVAAGESPNCLESLHQLCRKHNGVWYQTSNFREFSIPILREWVERVEQ